MGLLLIRCGPNGPVNLNLSDRSIRPGTAEISNSRCKSERSLRSLIRGQLALIDHAMKGPRHMEWFLINTVGSAMPGDIILCDKTKIAKDNVELGYTLPFGQ